MKKATIKLYAYIDTINLDDDNRAHITFDCITQESASNLIRNKDYRAWLEDADISIVQTTEPLSPEYTQRILNIVNSTEDELLKGWLVLELSEVPNGAPVNYYSIQEENLGEIEYNGMLLYLSADEITTANNYIHEIKEQALIAIRFIDIEKLKKNPLRINDFIYFVDTNNKEELALAVSLYMDCQAPDLCTRI